MNSLHFKQILNHISTIKIRKHFSSLQTIHSIKRRPSNQLIDECDYHLLLLLKLVPLAINGMK